MALAAVSGGADRVFLMGYDYHYGGSEVGASAPMARRDGAIQDLPWSLDLYAAVWVAMLNYRESKTWKQLQDNGMAADHSWERSAREYEHVYARAMA